jgi:hypothetical protein
MSFRKLTAACSISCHVETRFACMCRGLMPGPGRSMERGITDGDGAHVAVFGQEMFMQHYSYYGLMSRFIKNIFYRSAIGHSAELFPTSTPGRDAERGTGLIRDLWYRCSPAPGLALMSYEADSGAVSGIVSSLRNGVRAVFLRSVIVRIPGIDFMRK